MKNFLRSTLVFPILLFCISLIIPVERASAQTFAGTEVNLQEGTPGNIVLSNTLVGTTTPTGAQHTLPAGSGMISFTIDPVGRQIIITVENGVIDNGKYMLEFSGGDLGSFTDIQVDNASTYPTFDDISASVSGKVVTFDVLASLDGDLNPGGTFIYNFTSTVASPQITSTTYDASSGVLTVTGTDFVANSGGDDIDVSKLSITGEGGTAYPLTSGNVELIDATTFSVILNGTDKTAVNNLLNVNGSSSASSHTTYNIAASAGWMTMIADASNPANGITVSGWVAPTATTDAATSVTTTSATVNATVNDNGQATTVKFRLHTDEGTVTGGSGGDVESASSVSAGAGSTAVSYNYTTLSPGNTYYYRVEATNITGTTNGSTLTVTTLPDPPTSLSANNVSATGFTVNWTASSVPVVSGYRLDVATDAGFTGILPSYNSLFISGKSTVSQAVTGLTPATKYWYRLRAENAGGQSSYSGSGSQTTQSLPSISSVTYDASSGVLSFTGTNFAANGSGDDIVVSKLSITGEAGSYYTLTTPNVEISSSTSFSVTLNTGDKAGINSVLIKNGTSSVDNTTYNLAAAIGWMTAVPSASNTTNGITVSGWVAPTAATNAATNVTTTSAKVNATVNDNGQGTTVKFRLSANPADITTNGGDVQSASPVGAGAGSTAVLYNYTTLSPGNTYYYRVEATNATGTTNGSTLTVTTLPNPPSGLSASDVSTTGFTVNWNASTSYLVSGYRLDVATNIGFTNILPSYNGLFISGKSTISQAVTGLTPATKYWYRLRAENAGGQSSYSGSGSQTTQSLPSISSVTYDASSGVLSFTGTNFAANGSGDDIVVSKLSITGEAGSYYTLTTANVEISSSTSFSVTLNTDDKAGINSVLVKNGTSSADNITYNLAAAIGWMTAVPSASNATNGITVSGWVAPTATTNAATNVTTASAKVNATVNDNGQGTTIQFRLSTNPADITGNGGTTVGASPSSISAGAGATAASYNFTSLNPGTLYYYRVEATNLTGTTNGNTLTVTTNTAVSSIARASATPTNATSLNFTVTFSSDVTGVDATDFSLTETGTVSGTIGTPTGSGTTWTVPVTGITGDGVMQLNFIAPTGITPNADGIFTGGQSYTIDHTPPAKPTGLGATRGDAQVALNWNANIEGDLASYKVYGGTSASPTTLITTVAATATTYTDINLTNGSTYYYRITAVDDKGNESTTTADVTGVPIGSQTITFNALSAATYGDADIDPGATASSSLGVMYLSSNMTVATIAGSKIHIVGVGSATITAMQTGNSSFLPAADKTQTLTVTAKDITVSLDNTPAITRQYNGLTTATLAAGNYSFTGLVSGDESKVNISSSTAAYDTKEIGTTKTITVSAFTLGGTAASNYHLTTTSATVTGIITAKPLTLTLTGTPQITKEYDKSAAAALAEGNYVLTGVVNSDTVSVTGTAVYDNDQVATGKMITVNSFVMSGTDKDNYTLPPATLTVTGNITAKPISLTLNASPLITRQYNKTTAATLATGNYTLNGVISGDAISATGTATYDNDQVGTGKTITVNSFALSGTDKDNYNLLTTSATVTGIITAKQITLTLNGVPAIVKGYDATNTATLAAGNYSLQNIESGDDVSVAGTATYNDAKAGINKTITVNSFALSGAQKDNYQLLTNTANIVGTITAKPLTLTLTNTPQITKEYDKSAGATLAAGNYVLTGIINSDAVSVTGTAAYDNDQVGTGKTITVNSFALSGTDKDNYTLPPATLTVTGNITAKPISLTLNASPLITRQYNKTTVATLATGNYTLNGVISGDAISATGTATYDNDQVGTGKTITVNSIVLSGAQKDNYNMLTTSATVTGNITAKQITLTLNGVPAIVKGYDATNTATLAAGNYSLQNIESGDDVSVTGTATYDDAKAGINKTITVNSFALSGAQKDNYQLLTNTANIVGTITAKPLTLTLTSTPQITKEYDKSATAALAASNYVLTGIINSDAVGVSGIAAYDNDQAGTGKTITVNSFALSGTDKNNYTLPPATLTVTGNITAKPISLTLNASPLITRQYNKTTAATLATGNYTLNGVISGDAISATGTVAYDNDQIGTGKTITVNSIVLSGAQKDNYNLLTTTATVTGNITAKQITLTLNGVPPIVKGYDATNTATLAAGNYSLQNIESGDDVSVVGTATYADAKAGINKTITVNSFVLSGAQKDNYQLLTNTANIVGTITAKPLTLTLTGTPQITKEYDKSASAALASNNYVLTGVINSDAVSVTGAAAYDNDQVGTGKTITVNSFALSGTDKDNYTLPPATLTVTGNITAKPISLTLNASPLITRQYNKTTAAALATGNYTLNGVISGDVISATGTATYDNDQVGTGKTITVNSIVLSGAQKDNYNLLTTTATVTGNITAKQITLTLNGVPPIVKGYDATNTATLAAGNYSLQNIESGDDVSVAGTATYNDAKAGINKTITVNSFVLSGAQKDNYQLLTNTANIVGTITAKPLTLTLTGTPQITKEYDKSSGAALAAGNYVLTGVINSDAVSVTGTAAYDNDQVGTSKTITVNSFALSGTDKDNYTLPPATLTVTGDITTKPISLTLNASPLISKTYDGNATATLQSGNYALSGIISGDNVSVTGTAAYDNAQAAVSKNITVNSLVLSGAQKDNYNLLTTTVNTTGDITAKAITVTADNTSKTYGDADPALTYTFSPVLIGGDAFSGALTRTAGENAGSYPVQQGTLSLPANYTVNYTTANLSINAKAVNVTADAKSKVYGDTDPVLTYSVAPILVSGDVFTGALTRSSGEHTGTYPVALGTLALSSNYTLSFTGVNFTIDARPISVTADAKNKTYGDIDPALTYQFTPALISGDAFTGTLTRTAGETVGTYPISKGSLALSSDYTLNYTTADLTIAASANADLSSLVLSNGTLSPAFDAATQTYSVTVSHTTTSIALTPTAAMEVSTIKVNGVTVVSGATSGDIALNPGANTITVAVTAQDGTTQKDYTVNINRIAVSSNADLSTLVLDPGTLQPGFHTDTLSYKVAIAQNIASVTLTPTASEPASVINVNGSVTASGNAISVATTADVNMVTITVTAEDGTTQKVYTIQFVKPVTTWTGAANNSWTNAGNWTNGVPDLVKLAVIADVQPRPLVSSNQSVMDITVNQGAAVSLAANLQVAGSLVNNGTFSGTGTLVFNGNTAQQISGTGRISNMTNDNSNGLAIAGGAGNTISITGILTLHTGTLATGDNLVLVSDSLGTAALAPVPAGASVTGKVTVERWMLSQRGYRTMAHPFNSALPLSQLQDDFSVSGSGDGFVTGLGYSTASVSYYDSVGVNPPAFKRPLSNAPNTTSTPVWTVGRGILALVRGKGNEGLGGTYADVTQPSAFAADAAGELNQGTLEYKLGANVTGTSFNLVGNPYAAPINIRLLKSNNGAVMNSNNGSAGIGNTIYVYNPYKNAGISASPSQEVRGGMDAYTNDGSSDIIIPSFGAFFVQAKAAGNIIAFDENVKAVGQQPITIMGGSPSKLTLSLENNRGSWDDIKIRWDKEAGAEGTDSYDGAKMHNELLDLYSITSDNKQLCIDSRSDSFNREEIIPLGISTEVKDPSFRFRVSAYKMPANIQVYLLDKLLNTETLLSAVNDTYDFAISSDSMSKGDKRFELAIRFRKEAPVPVDDVSAGVKITPNPFRNELVVQLGTEARSSGITQVRLISMSGTVVKTTKAAANASMIRMNTADLAAGVYFAEVTNDKVRTIKQVIRQ